eukprot:scaffold3472_cov136-Isochrysis_galbana.AAC.7
MNPALSPVWVTGAGRRTAGTWPRRRDGVLLPLPCRLARGARPTGGWGSKAAKGRPSSRRGLLWPCPSRLLALARISLRCLLLRMLDALLVAC